MLIGPQEGLPFPKHAQEVCVSFDVTQYPVTYIGPVWTRDEDDEFILPDLTLGWQVAGWCSKFLSNPDGDGPWKFTFEQLRFILWWYAVDHTGRFVYREGVLQRLKGWGKDPLAAVMCMVELCGPSVFSHFDENGSPVAKARMTAWVEIYAVSKEQTVNTTALLPTLITEHMRLTYDMNVGKEIIYARGGKCSLRVKSAGHRTAEGGRPTFMVLGEIQHWVPSNGGTTLFDTITNNATKGFESRWLAITNAYLPGEDSVGERIRGAQEAVWAGKAHDTGVLYDSIEAHPKTPLSPDALRAVIPVVRGDAIWLDPENIISRVLNTATRVAHSRRMWLNQIVADEDALVGPEDIVQRPKAKLGPGDRIVLGFDGSYVKDATALVAIRVHDMVAFPLLIEEPPLNPPDDWEVDRDKVDAAVHKAFRTYDVVAFFADVRLWESYISGWVAEYGHKINVTSGGRNKFAWDMRGAQQRVTIANELTVQMLQEGHLTFPDMTEGLGAHFRNHILNARRRENRYGVSFDKETKDSPKKIDAYAALVLAAAALDAYRNKAPAKPQRTGRGWFA